MASASSMSVMAQSVNEPLEKEVPHDNSYIQNRIYLEDKAEDNPFSLTTHKMNYILPYTYVNGVNTDVYNDFDSEGLSKHFTDSEAKFQLSLKVPILGTIFYPDDHLYFGMTMKSFWQVYSSETSRPFRTTDYNPELFYSTSLDKFGFEHNYLTLGLEHESNGETQYLSRSWNRAYAQIITEKPNYAVSLKLWTRLSEDSKEYDYDPEGDDNPDIIDYMGNAELSGVYKHNDLSYSFKGRHNLETGYGYIELGMTFPIHKNLKGYVQYVNGYGESLLDYNYHQQRFGIGFVFSDML